MGFVSAAPTGRGQKRRDREEPPQQFDLRKKHRAPTYDDSSDDDDVRVDPLLAMDREYMGDSEGGSEQGDDDEVDALVDRLENGAQTNSLGWTPRKNALPVPPPIRMYWTVDGRMTEKGHEHAREMAECLRSYGDRNPVAQDPRLFLPDYAHLFLGTDKQAMLPITGTLLNFAMVDLYWRRRGVHAALVGLYHHYLTTRSPKYFEIDWSVPVPECDVNMRYCTMTVRLLEKDPCTGQAKSYTTPYLPVEVLALYKRGLQMHPANQTTFHRFLWLGPLYLTDVTWTSTGLTESQLAYKSVIMSIPSSNMMLHIDWYLPVDERGFLRVEGGLGRIHESACNRDCFSEWAGVQGTTIYPARAAR